GTGRLEKGGSVGSRPVLSSGFTIRRACYARASEHRSEERRRRDRKGANEVIAGRIFHPPGPMSRARLGTHPDGNDTSALRAGRPLDVGDGVVGADIGEGVCAREAGVGPVEDPRALQLVVQFGFFSVAGRRLSLPFFGGSVISIVTGPPCTQLSMPAPGLNEFECTMTIVSMSFFTVRLIAW